jgi:hypothetical protein
MDSHSLPRPFGGPALADHTADSQDELDVERCEAVKLIVAER